MSSISTSDDSDIRSRTHSHEIPLREKKVLLHSPYKDADIIHKLCEKGDTALTTTILSATSEGNMRCVAHTRESATQK